MRKNILHIVTFSLALRTITESFIMTIKEYNLSVESFSDMLYRFLIKNTGNKDLSGDIIQDVYLRLWEKRRLVVFENAKSYLFKMAYNRMIDYYRKEKYDEQLDNLQLSNNQNNDEFDTKAIIENALNRLPRIQKAVITLRDYEGYSYEEIGKILSLNESQVKVYIYRGRKNLRQYLVSIENVL